MFRGLLHNTDPDTGAITSALSESRGWVDVTTMEAVSLPGPCILWRPWSGDGDGPPTRVTVRYYTMRKIALWRRVVCRVGETVLPNDVVHTTLVVHGIEHSFGAAHGVVELSEPLRVLFGYRFSREVDVGTTRLTQEGVAGVTPGWVADDYHFVKRNCHDFTRRLAMAVVDAYSEEGLTLFRGLNLAARWVR